MLENDEDACKERCVKQGRDTVKQPGDQRGGGCAAQRSRAHATCEKQHAKLHDK